ncbi:37121_t:CDS:1, partial [Racocetra persica]
MTKGEIHFMNILPEMRIYKSFYENSFNNEFLNDSPPYQLTIGIDELISPPKNSRKATNFRKNPYSSSPPRPQNAFVLFRRDFSAKLKLKEMKTSNGDVSRLASEEWSKQPKEVLRFFEFLENLAKDRHKKIYPDYSYSPKRKSKSKNNTCRKNNEVTSEAFLIKSINKADHNFSESLSFNAQGICKPNTEYSDFTTNNSQSERERSLDFSEYIYFDPQ